MTLRGWLAVAPAAAAAFAVGYDVPGHLASHRPAFVFSCPPAGEGAAARVDVSQIAARARLVEAAALRQNGGTADTKSPPQVIAIVALGLPGLDPGSTGTLLDDAHRRCRRVTSAWAIVAFRRSGAADACCLDTIFVAFDSRHWFVF